MGYVKYHLSVFVCCAEALLISGLVVIMEPLDCCAGAGSIHRKMREAV